MIDHCTNESSRQCVRSVPPINIRSERTGLKLGAGSRQRIESMLMRPSEPYSYDR